MATKQSEHALQNVIRNALAGMLPMFRANVGTGWTGDVERMPGGKVLIHNARPFDTGLPTGFSDLFGVRPVVITQDMVGQTIGQAVFGEVKTDEGRATGKQLAFLQAMTKWGALAGVWRSAADALAMIQTGESNQ